MAGFWAGDRPDVIRITTGNNGRKYQQKQPIFPTQLSKPTQVKREVIAQLFNLIRARNPPAGSLLASTIWVGRLQKQWIGPHIICSRKWRRWNVNKLNSKR